MAVSATLAAAALGPTETVRGAVDEVIRILRDPSLKAPGKADQRLDALRRAAGPLFDTEDMARRSLGVQWRPRTTEERRQYVALFQELLERSYFLKIQGYSGERVVYTGQSVDGLHATVSTRIVTTAGKEIPVEYRMHQRDGDWSVYDVLVEGVSLIGDYRTQFTTIIEESSFRELLHRIQDKVRQLGGEISGKPA